MRSTHDSTTIFDAELLACAREAQGNAYAPYSSFPVGAAVKTDKGVFLGVNVENAAYASTICAEAAAVASARTAGATEFESIAVAGVPGEPCPPCGNCRQILNELGDPRVILDGSEGPTSRPLSMLLPHAFGPDSLDFEEDR